MYFKTQQMKAPQLVFNELKVYHFPQIPCKPFEVDVKDEFEAKKVIDVLTEQHLWLFENKMIPDYCNAIDVVMLEDGEWVSYYNEGEEMDWEQFEQEYLTREKVDA